MQEAGRKAVQQVTFLRTTKAWKLRERRDSNPRPPVSFRSNSGDQQFPLPHVLTFWGRGHTGAILHDLRITLSSVGQGPDSQHEPFSAFKQRMTAR